VDAARAVRVWVEAWERAWPVGDAAALEDVYAPGAVFYSHPFRARQPPSEYVEWAFGEQTRASCRFGVPIVDGDRAAVDWWAVLTGREGEEETIAGTSLLRFGEDGRVVEQRDAWAVKPGRNDLPDWAPGR